VSRRWSGERRLRLGRAWARGFAAFIDEYASDSSASEAIVADACLSERPGLRHPFDDQVSIDTAHRISDEHYLQTCRGDNVDSIVDWVGLAASAWTVGQAKPH
jgi:predicted secreted protein